MSNKAFLIVFLLMLFQISFANAWQVKGRPTLPSDCRAGEHWVRDHAKTTGDYTAYCRLSSGKSQPISYEFLRKRIFAGRPIGWPWNQEQLKTWQENEIGLLFEVFDLLPERLWPEALKGIYRMRKSKDSSNPASNGGGLIVLYDEAFSQKMSLPQIIAHELAHVSYSSMSAGDQKSYELATGWGTSENKKSQKKEVIIARRDGYVKSDGKLSPDEDFANNVEYFLFHPSNLQKVTPHAYTWIKNHFGDNFRLRK